MMGRTTLKEVREALAAAQSGRPDEAEANSTTSELELLAGQLAESADAPPSNNA